MNKNKTAKVTQFQFNDTRERHNKKRICRSNHRIKHEWRIRFVSYRFHLKKMHIKNATTKRRYAIVVTGENENGERTSDTALLISRQSCLIVLCVVCPTLWVSMNSIRSSEWLKWKRKKSKKRKKKQQKTIEIIQLLITSIWFDFDFFCSFSVPLLIGRTEISYPYAFPFHTWTIPDAILILFPRATQKTLEETENSKNIKKEHEK